MSDHAATSPSGAGNKRMNPHPQPGDTLIWRDPDGTDQVVIIISIRPAAPHDPHWDPYNPQWTLTTWGPHWGAKRTVYYEGHLRGAERLGPRCWRA